MKEKAQNLSIQGAKQKADEFLSIASQFRLGDLPTESQHPKTLNLSDWSQNNLPLALRTMREVDCDAIRLILPRCDQILQLAREMLATLKNGKRIYFVGCGATGRLSLSLEVLWRESVGETHPWADSVRSLMAGGDVALVRSIENFEDHPEFGARMLDEAGFTDGDLLVASTEGGETPYVIGAALHAPEISGKDHWYLYCNPESVLIEKLERCQQVIRNRRLNKLNLTVGPMAISGSTRMQASTVLMLAAGTALFECLKDHPTFDSIEESINCLLDHMGDLNNQPLASFIVQESECYRRGESLVYTTKDYGITVITDTTERSPTFSLAPFENRQDTGAAASLCYLCLPSTHTAEDAWNLLLRRTPRPLTGWQDYENIGGPKRLSGYDFSSSLPKWRQTFNPEVTQKTFDISRTAQGLCFKFENLEATFPTKGLSLLNEHLTLKMLLNMHSTLVMGRLERYHGNVMTCVRPSNFKLIDRTIRYVQLLLKREGINSFSYEDICLQCFTELEDAAINEPVVLKVFDILKTQARAQRESGHSGTAGISKGHYESRAFSMR